ncbi:hypothetical protein METP1_01816 [Methanosarcinales archaeon]|nr:hypothetical protein METP1_01816 [Methanosarcinales archaeon]
MQTKNQYIPGACNIGKGEVNRRIQGGWFGLIVTIFLYGFLVYLGAPRPWRLVIFIPAMMAAVGFLQARMRFCAYFGMHGVFNFSLEAGKTEIVGQAEFRAMDRRKALQIIIYSVGIGALVAAAAYFLP